MNAKIFTMLLMALMLVGCATTESLKGRADLLNFLSDGKTPKEEVITTLGQPSGRFEGEKIITYRIGFEPKGYYIVEREAGASGWPTWLRAKYSLVLVFDDSGVLRKHSLVEVNK